MKSADLFVALAALAASLTIGRAQTFEVEPNDTVAQANRD
jgi:hypothetical protein